MRYNYARFDCPQFRILSKSQLDELHMGVLQILERTGVSFVDCPQAIQILGDAGADVSNPDRVKIPSYLVEQGLRTAPKTISFYSTVGEPAFVLNAMSGAHFGSLAAGPYYLDPKLRQQVLSHPEDIADMCKVTDALPNLEWIVVGGTPQTVPASIADQVSFLQTLANTSKTTCVSTADVGILKELMEIASIVAGGEERLREKPFFIGASDVVSPLTQASAAIERSLLCAEKGIPNIVYSMPMAGATVPSTWAAVLALSATEVLSQLVVIQLQYPGAPVIFGGMPNIMDMKTSGYHPGSPELSFLTAALSEQSHYYKLPVFSTAGCTDSRIVDAQAGAEVTYNLMLATLSGAGLAHDVGLIGEMISTELMVLCNEIIDMIKVIKDGVDINDETLPFDLIDRVGPGGSYIEEKHTYKHFRSFFTPKLFYRKWKGGVDVKNCPELINEKTIEILKTHQPKPLPEDVVKELKKVEESLLKQEGLKELPKRE